jgi:arylsulfatase A-like enzyme
MAESFQSAGYLTAAFVNNSLAGKPLTGAGFDEFTEDSASAPDVTQRGPEQSDIASATADHVLSWLDTQGTKPQPFFLYVHFMAPHSPYDPPNDDDLFQSKAYPNLSDTGYNLIDGALMRLATGGDQKAVERLYELYDGKIHHVDRYVGKILDRLHSLGLDGNTYVLLTSDHGELLYSHPDDFDTFDHRSLYDTALHIPLIVAGPGIPSGTVRSGLASNIDTAPTLLTLAGLPDLNDAEGHSLVPMINKGAPSGNRFVFAEEDLEIPLRSVHDDHYKLIRNLWTGEEQLFDLQSDPEELHDVSGSDPTVVKQLNLELDKWMNMNEPSREVQLRRWKIFTQFQNVVTVDDITTGGAFLIRPRQAWHSDVNPASGNLGGGSYWTESGDGTRVAIWRGDNPLVGTYKIFVYLGQPKVGQLATNAAFTVVAEGATRTVQIDLQAGANTWRSLGIYENPRYVELTNAANGIVVADAVRFQRMN